MIEMNKKMNEEEQCIYYWRNNIYEKFYNNYEDIKNKNNFLNIFFGNYKRTVSDKFIYKDDDYLEIEDDFLQMIIKLEDIYLIIKYIKKHNLDYKKLFKECEIKNE